MLAFRASYAFPKSARLRKKKDYLPLSRQATGFKGDVIFIFWQRTQLPNSRLGITVTRKYGNAVQRNHFKRIVRENFRLCQHLMPVGIDCNIRPRGKVEDPSGAPTFAEVKKDLFAFISKFSQ